MTLRRIQETMQPVLLVAPFWPNRPWFYLLLLLLTPANKTRFVISGERDVVASKVPHSEVMGVAPRGNPVILECSQGVEHTLLNARAPSTWRAYAGKRKAFSQWFEEKEIVPHDCTLRDLLDFLQSLLEHVFSCSTIKVYVAALSAYRGPVEGMTLVMHNLIRSFLKSVSRLRPSRNVMVPQWDLNLVLSSLSCAPFEPLMNAAIKWLSLKSAFLLAIATARCVSELHALSVSPQCLRWGPECKQATLWPNSVFLPKLLSPQYINKPIIISAFTDDCRSVLCPVRALQQYVEVTAAWRATDQLFVCHGDYRKGTVVSKDRLSHWVTEVIVHTYANAGHELPASVKCHLVCAVATSWAALRGVQLSDICDAATWKTPSTFARFYRLNVVSMPPVCSVMLTNDS